MPISRALPRETRVLIQVIHGILGISVGWFMFYSPWDNLNINLGGSAMIVLAVYPLVVWLRRNDDSYPLIETLLAITIPFYVIPLASEHAALAHFPEEVVVRAIHTVVLFQASVIVGAKLTRQRYRRSSTFWTKPLIAENRQQFMVVGLLANTAWLVMASMPGLIPATLRGSMRALFFGIGIISAFTLARIWGKGLLAGGMKIVLVINLIVQFSLISTSLLLIQSLSLFGATLMGYFSTSRRIPWFVAGTALTLFTILHNGKSEMRKVYWEEQKPAPTIEEIPAFYSEWLDRGIRIIEQDENEAALRLFERASLLQIVALVVDRVPTKYPYLSGDSYWAIPAQVVPRVLWPGKPSPNHNQKLLSVGLGVLSAEQSETTSIGFGMISEAYANFGSVGAILLGLSIGYLLQWVGWATLGASTFSPHGLLRVLSLAWCLNAEVILIVWISSFYQACVALIVPLIVWSKLSPPPPNPRRP